jgi:hypothetical protein
MITPTPTTKIAPDLARGVLTEVVAPTATRPGYIVLSIPNTSYELHLLPEGSSEYEVGKKLVGKIRAAARRIDVVKTGGKYIEPVYGKPRRVQGRVVGTSGNDLIVDVTVPFVVTPTDARQKATDFAPGDLVAFDLPEMPTFSRE